MFMLRMIGSNSGDFVCTQLLHNLWKLFLFKRHAFRKNTKEHTEDFPDQDILIEDSNYLHQDESNQSSEDEEFKMKRSKHSQIQKKKKTIFTKLFKEPARPSGKRIETNLNRSFKLKPTFSQSLKDNSNQNFAEIQRFQSIKRVSIANKSKTHQNSTS